MKNTLTIICGVPGSGKSTLARKLISEGYADVYFEADMFMYENGEYVFNPKKLGECHTKCQEAVKDALYEGKNVIVSNTSVTKKERQTYIDIAREVGCNVIIRKCTGNYKSIHNVPDHVVQNMKRKLDSEWE